jgi:hypothetical protein
MFYYIEAHLLAHYIQLDRKDWFERHLSFFFLALHHQNNLLGNISILFWPTFNSVAKIFFLGKKKYISWTLAPFNPKLRLCYFT